MKVLRKGYGKSKYQCQYCGSLLEYDENDIIFIEKAEKLFTTIPEQIIVTYKCIECPICNKTLELSNNKNKGI